VYPYAPWASRDGLLLPRGRGEGRGFQSASELVKHSPERIGGAFPQLICRRRPESPPHVRGHRQQRALVGEEPLLGCGSLLVKAFTPALDALRTAATGEGPAPYHGRPSQCRPAGMPPGK